MAPEDATSSEPTECAGRCRCGALPHGGKLLSGDQSVKLAILDNVDRDTLIAHIVDGMRAEQRARDARALQAINRTRQRLRKGR